MDKLVKTELELWKSSLERYISVRQVLIMEIGKVLRGDYHDSLYSHPYKLFYLEGAYDHELGYLTSEHVVPNCAMCEVHYDRNTDTCCRCPWGLKFGYCNRQDSLWRRLIDLDSAKLALSVVDTFLIPNIKDEIWKLEENDE